MSEKYSPAARLRLLADWFDMYDDTDAADRGRLLLDPRSPGQHGVAADLRFIAAGLSPSAPGRPGPDELKNIAAWFEAHPALVGRILDERPGPHSRDVQRNLRLIADRLEAARSN